MLNNAVAIVAIDVIKLFLLVVMHACSIIYCSTSPMLNNAVAIVAIDVSKLLLLVVMHAQ